MVISADPLANGFAFSDLTYGPGCELTCPTNITVSNDLNQCGAVVSYSAPTSPTCGCGSVECSPASGSFFPVGTTTVTCTPEVGSSCDFTVTVNDTQPPPIDCPMNIISSTDPKACTAVVNYTPTASDNCMGASAPICMPPSGSTFQIGTTMVTCTVMDASGNTAGCSFNVTVADTQAPSINCPVKILTTVPTPDIYGIFQQFGLEVVAPVGCQTLQADVGHVDHGAPGGGHLDPVCGECIAALAGPMHQGLLGFEPGSEGGAGGEVLSGETSG
ncbi:MAG: HYR domain-containing protein [Acidobacteria bacterium]|nr:HYR domain-containing protein [Acidobacteriota bacterium]